MSPASLDGAPTSPHARTYRPTTKVIAATGGSAIGAAVSTLVGWGFANASVTVPDDVNKAVTCLIVAGLTAVSTFGSGYFTRFSRNQTVAIDPQTGRSRICRVRGSSEVPDRQERLHVAEGNGDRYSPVGEIRFGFAGNGLCNALRVGPAGQADVIPGAPGFRAEVKFFGRRGSEVLGDGVLVSFEGPPEPRPPRPWSCYSEARTAALDAEVGLINGVARPLGLRSDET
jgi:hypothetical protein